MSRLASVLVLALVATSAATDTSSTAGASASGTRRGRGGVDVVVPVDPHEHERLHFFDGRAHHVLPGTVVVNRAPYACDVDGRTFDTEAAFVLHLRRAHHADPETLAGDVVAGPDGVLHWVGK